jgi:hypothetical protein
LLRLFFRDNLADLEVVKVIIQIISDSQDDKKLDDLKLEVLHLGIALLLGGNVKVQAKFLAELVDQRQNQFLIQVKKMLDKNFMIVKKYMEYHNEWLQEQLIESVQRATIKKALESRQGKGNLGKNAA